MSSTLVESFLDELSMAQLAGPEVTLEGPEPPAPNKHEEPNEPKAPTTKFTLKLKEDKDFELREATRKREFKGGEQASFSLWYKLAALTTSGGESLATLGKERLDEMKAKKEEVYITTGNGSTVAAKFQGAHGAGAIKREPLCTLHVVWDLALATPEHPEPKPKRKAAKRKAESADSEPERKAPNVGPEVPDNVMFCIFLSTDDFLVDEPSLAEIANHMRTIAGHFAHLLPAEMPPDTFITALLDPCMGSYLNEQFKVDHEAASRAMHGFTLVTSPFSPKKALDLVEVRKFLQAAVFRNGEIRNGESFSVVLGYDNATVVNETLPDMAFGDNKRALGYRARTQSPASSDSEPDFIDLRDADSDSDHESDSI